MHDSWLHEPWDWTGDDLLSPTPLNPDANAYLDYYSEDDYLNDQFEQFDQLERLQDVRL